MQLSTARNWARSAALVLVGAGAACVLYADNMVVTYAPAGIQTPNTATLCGSAPGDQCWIGQENFDSWDGSVPLVDSPFPTLVSIGGLAGEISGTYSGGLQRYGADSYGGAGGTGYYPELFGSTYTLNLSTSGDLPGVNYFGLWFSALDAGNQLEFYQDNTLLYTFTPGLFQSLVGACTGGNPFCGNPNNPSQDSGEQFAFLNVYDMDGSFNKIVYTQTGGGGFESDNHTVGYMNPPTLTGTVIGAIPEPSTLLLFGSGLLGLAGIARRRIGRKA